MARKCNTVYKCPGDRGPPLGTFQCPADSSLEDKEAADSRLLTVVKTVAAALNRREEPHHPHTQSY